MMLSAKKMYAILFDAACIMLTIIILFTITRIINLLIWNSSTIRTDIPLMIYPSLNCCIGVISLILGKFLSPKSNLSSGFKFGGLFLLWYGLVMYWELYGIIILFIKGLIALIFGLLLLAIIGITAYCKNSEEHIK